MSDGKERRPTGKHSQPFYFPAAPSLSTGVEAGSAVGVVAVVAVAGLEVTAVMGVEAETS